MISDLTNILVPAALANIMPVLVKKVNFLNYPVNYRLFGKNKTWRGLFFGVLVSIVISYFLTDVIYGLVIGSSVLIGDLGGSFFKRRAGYKPGQKFFPLDQLDSAAVLGAALVLIYSVSLKTVFVLILVWFFGHILFKHAGYSLGINKERW